MPGKADAQKREQEEQLDSVEKLFRSPI